MKLFHLTYIDICQCEILRLDEVIIGGGDGIFKRYWLITLITVDYFSMTY